MEERVCLWCVVCGVWCMVHDRNGTGACNDHAYAVPFDMHNINTSGMLKTKK